MAACVGMLALALLTQDTRATHSPSRSPSHSRSHSQSQFQSYSHNDTASHSHNNTTAHSPPHTSRGHAVPPSAFSVSERVFVGSVDGSVPRVRMIVLANSDTGERVELLRSWGGKIERAKLCKRAGRAYVHTRGAHTHGVYTATAEGACAAPPRDVIASRCDSDGQTGGPNCTATLLQGSPSLGAMLIPFANRIAHGRYTFGGAEHTLSTDNSTVSHGFLIQGRPLELLQTDISSTHAAVTLGVIFNGTDIGYPYKLSVNITYTLTDQGALHVTVRARNDNNDGSALPFMAGCHPYFKLLHGDFRNAKLVLDRCGADTGGGWNRQAQTDIQVPSGLARRFYGFNGSDTLADPHTGCPACIHSDGSMIWDDGFTNIATVPDCPSLTMRILDGPDDTLTLELRKSYRYVQVYTGNAVGVAVEPMSSETNAFNNHDGLIVLEDGGQWEGEFAIGIESKHPEEM